MRKTFVDTLTEMARQDDKIMCVIGDTGFSVFEEFEKEFKERFINVGIAEQNFVSFGAGLAAMGMKPYLYNVVSFMTLRAAEQIALDICYQENPVVLVGVGGGFAYGPAGPTHHALHDLAIMSELPNMTVVCPADPIEMKAVMWASMEYKKPLYIRIGRSIDPIIHTGHIDFKIGHAIRVREGKDAILITTGVTLKTAMEAAEQLENSNISLEIYSMHTIKPIDKDTIITCEERGIPIFTLEEHSVLGGLGDAVGRVLLEHMSKIPMNFCKLGVSDTFAPVTGSREYLDNLFGLGTTKIVEKIKKVLLK